MAVRRSATYRRRKRNAIRRNRRRSRSRWSISLDKRWIMALLGIAAAVVLALAIFAPPKDDSVAPQGDPMEGVRSESQREIAVFDEKAGGIITMPLEEYIVYALAGEMPASYEIEALKAQAVAARTYLAHKLAAGTGCTNMPGADICTSSAHCQAFSSRAALEERWGEDFDVNFSRLCGAVQSTAGQIALYDDAPIEALYFASSGGATEDSEHVFSAAQPYLKSVDSPGEGEMGRNNGEQKLSASELVSRIEKKYPKSNVTEDSIATDLEIISRYDSGRVEKIRVGDVEISGKEARSLFSLNSANFTMAFGDGYVTFTTKGFGHGVGMSQAGANAMAQSGSTYDAILAHYYTGIHIGNLRDFSWFLS